MNGNGSQHGVKLNAKGKPVGTTIRPGQGDKEAFTKVTPKGIKKGRRRSTAAGKGNWRSKFLTALANVPNVAASCEEAGITPPTAYNARKKSQLFAKQWDQALKLAVGRLTNAAIKRARDGVEKRIWMKNAAGKPVCVDKVREFSDTLTIFLLKSHDPKTYREPPREGGTLSVKAPDGTEATAVWDCGVAEKDLP
jgi:hypothetical protein